MRNLALFLVFVIIGIFAVFSRDKFHFSEKPIPPAGLPADTYLVERSKEEMCEGMTSRNDKLRVDADFDGDGIVDFGAFLKNKEGSVGFYTYLSTTQSGRFSINNMPSVGDMYIELQKKDKIKTACGRGAYPCGEGEPTEIEMFADGMILGRCMSAASLIYYDPVAKALKETPISD